VDQGEGFTEAVRREIREETGLQEIQVDYILGTMHFYRGETRPENELVGVEFCCTTEHPEAVQISAEHSEGHWLTPAEIEKLLPEGSWIVGLIQRSETMRRLLPDELLSLYRDTVFAPRRENE
jgi:ADP-ribose pyrophosphatase YjhB (NUDIX family)